MNNVITGWMKKTFLFSIPMRLPINFLVPMNSSILAEEKFPMSNFCLSPMHNFSVSLKANGYFRKSIHELESMHNVISSLRKLCYNKSAHLYANIRLFLVSIFSVSNRWSCFISHYWSSLPNIWITSPLHCLRHRSFHNPANRDPFSWTLQGMNLKFHAVKLHTSSLKYGPSKFKLLYIQCAQ